MTIITLLTDFGERDEYVGIMKGVILGIAAEAHLVDLSHAIEPQDVLAGALLLARSVPYFPPGSIHLAVIDPGVGTSRRPIARQLGEQFFVGPDNGLLTLVYTTALEKKHPIKIVQLNQTRYWLPVVSRTFQGRDIFAPVAAHLARGVKLDEVGVVISDPVLLDIPKPFKISTGWRGQILHIDHFGNLATNLTIKELGSLLDFQVKYKDKFVTRLVKTYGEGKEGELIAILDSFGYLALNVVNGSAQQTLQAKIGDEVFISVSQISRAQ